MWLGCRANGIPEAIENQRTNGTEKAYLISVPSVSIKHTKPD